MIIKNIFDKRLIENNFGIADEKHYDEYHKLFVSEEAYFETPVPLGENYADVKREQIIFYQKLNQNIEIKKF